MSNQPPEPTPEPTPAPTPDPMPDPGGPPAQPPTPARKDWLRTVARATETMAPLVKPDVPDSNNLPTDTRGRWATLLAIFSLLVALLKFILDFFNLVSRPLAPVAGALPYLVGVLIIAGVVFAGYAAYKARLRVQRRSALAVAALLLLFGVAWGGWVAWDALRPPSGYRILVAEFDPEGPETTNQVDFARTIADQLRRDLRDAGVPVEIRRSLTSYQDSDEARRAGAQEKAGLVIWGHYNNTGVSPNIELLQPPTVERQALSIPILYGTASAAANPLTQATLDRVSTVMRAAQTPTDIRFFTTYGPGQVSFVASAVLGLSFLAAGDQAQAARLFDQALESVAGSPQAAQGQEIVLYQRALLRYDQGQLADARRDLEAALAIVPDFYEALQLLAMVLAESCTPTRDLAKALATAEHAAAVRPESAPAQRLVAGLRQQRGDLDGALVAAQRAQQLDPGAAETYLLLAGIYAGQGKPQDAEAAGRIAVDILRRRTTAAVQPSADLWAELGDAYRAVGQWEGALDAYRRAQELAPANSQLHAGVANALFHQNKLDAAAAEYRTWAAKDPANANPHLLLALLQRQQGDSAYAEAELRQASQLGVCSTDAPMLLGGLLFDQGKLAEAESSFRQALAVEPDNADIQYMLATSLMLQDRDADARPLLEQVTSSRPDWPAAQYALGLVYLQAGEAARAKATFAQLVAHADPAMPTVDLAFAYEHLDRPQDAIDIYRRLLAQHESAALHAYLAGDYQTLGDLALAAEEARAALKLDPNQPPALLILGNVLSAQNDAAGAAAAYEQYLTQTESPGIRTVLAQLYLQIGDTGKAAAHLARAAGLDPTNPEPLRLLYQLAAAAGRLDEAAGYLDAALKLRPNDVVLHLERAGLAYKACDQARYLLERERVHDLAGANPMVAGMLAGAYYAQKRSSDAAPLLAQLRAAPAADYLAHLAAGLLLAANGERTGAAVELSSVVTNTQATPAAAAQAQSTLGTLLSVENRLPEAAAAYTAALALEPGYAPAYAGLGDLALLDGQTGAAQEHYAAAIAALIPYSSTFGADQARLVNVHVLARQGVAQKASGDAPGAAQTLAQAEAAARRLLADAPRWPEARLALASVLAAGGQVSAASAEFDAAIGCDAGLAWARDSFLDWLAKVRG